MAKKNLFFAITEMQIKTTLRFHLTPVRIAKINKTSSGRDVGKGEPLFTVGGIAK